MKLRFSLGFCLLLPLAVFSQNYGGYRGAPGNSLHDSLAQSLAQDEARRATNAAEYAKLQAIQNFVPRQPWRALAGNTNYVKLSGVEFCGKIGEVTKDGVRMSGSFGTIFTTSDDPNSPNHTDFLVGNFPADHLNSQVVRADEHLMAWYVGTITYTPSNGPPETIKKLDYGIPCDPPPLSQEQLSAIKGKQETERKRLWQLQVNSMKVLSAEATNGDAGAQFNLGLHYLNGQGCETNREQGVYWLQKSADQGYSDASNKLASLQQEPNR